jgi:cysteine desulfurase/selenocysteine lyase
VAQSFARPRLKPGDEILISWMEHHSNIVPWQMVCEQTGATLRVVPITDQGELLLDEFDRLLSERTKLVSIIHVSNALGTINPIETIIARAHARGVPVLVDGAQAAPHLPVDVQALDCEFYAFSAHKMYGPTGAGALYGKRAQLEAMPPYQGGGDMIASVTFEKTTYNSVPHKFEAGTPNIAGVVGFGAAADYMRGFDMRAVAAHEHDLLTHATQGLSDVPGVTLLGTSAHKAGVLSFVLDGVHPHDIGTVLDRDGVAIRTGQHCAQPIMDRFGVPATARASFAIYNTHDEIDTFVRAVRRVREMFV